MLTEKNLKEAFSGESQANRKYIAFAKRAEEEGYSQIARLFRAAAEAETVHALAHLRVMKGIEDTASNLKAAIEGEGFEFKEMYPKFLEDARKEKESAAAMSFSNALAVEEIHHRLYKKALETLQAGKDLAASSIFVCSVCGNTVNGEPPDRCPVCNSPKKMFFEVK
ncbi:MAG: rubrerythrin family protein [Candidatus Abyssobacteria bacterium SURF_5]|uniref:Rubrerythrin family protein n=1 Tax=Abyssobacteria bacterium (strain SURF_5) TaxID=2093360 RepID=A0A3A4N8E1_ABYX5|nr:MAG: rubrerythrin family protein [Candidatus Abyssubacteria bacterium SURF_5]